MRSSRSVSFGPFPNDPNVRTIRTKQPPFPEPAAPHDSGPFGQTPDSSKTSTSGGARPLNRLLRALPAADLRRLMPDMETIVVRPRHVLYRTGEPLTHVYFPNGGVFSITTVLPDGSQVEVATVGDEGMGRHRNALRRGRDGAGRSVSASARWQCGEDQSTACNARHQVQERCARWLLMTHDRVHEQDFHLSHEFLAMMLGVRRPTVTVVAGDFNRRD